MAISTVSSSSFSRAVPPARSSHDREAEASARTEMVSRKAQQRAEQQRAVQEKLQQNRDETQRRLDGRLISFGAPSSASQQSQAEYNRSRVNQAYSASPYRVDRQQREQRENRAESPEQSDPIDIVV